MQYTASSSFQPTFTARLSTGGLTKQNNLGYLHSLSGPVVQLVRAPACHAGSYEFESRSGRQGNFQGQQCPFFCVTATRLSCFFLLLINLTFCYNSNSLIQVYSCFSFKKHKQRKNNEKYYHSSSITCRLVLWRR